MPDQSATTGSTSAAEATGAMSVSAVADGGLYWIRPRINGERRDVLVGHDIRPADTLAYLLKEKLGFTGLKISCDGGACGACTVLLDGVAVLSCMVLAVEADGREVLTIEGLPTDHPVVEAFAEQCEPGYGTALQCGYCTPGFVMAATAFLTENPSPTPAEIREGLSNNLCRCGCYNAIVQAVLRATEKMRTRGDAAMPGTATPAPQAADATPSEGRL